MASLVRAAFIFSCLAAAMVRAGDVCPAPPKYTSSRPADIAIDDHRIYIDSDDALLGADGNAVVNGRVRVRQDERSIAGDSVTYDYNTDQLNVKGSVDFMDPKLRVQSVTGRYDPTAGVDFSQANFQLMDRNGRGVAKQLAVSPDGKVELNQVLYTSCPVGKDDWMLQAAEINLDTKLQVGVAHHVTMRFMDVPIFYTPYISFPLGDERKSGVLFPNLGHSGSSGFELAVPYYFNLAPNYDLTLTPGILTARGVQLTEDFRYLTATSHGQIDATFLPDDKKDNNDSRSYVRFSDVTDLMRGLRVDADIANVSDSNYFQDFAVGTDQTSVTYLERRADLLYYDDAWRIRAQLQNFQTIDTLVSDADRPYSRVPRVQASALYPIAASNFEFLFDSEAVNFMREVGPTGLRLNLSPEIRWSSRGPGYFFEPAVGYDFTQYDLQDVAFGSPSTPTRALPYGRLDTGLVFERDAGGQRTQTLEPRIVYSYVPYRNQNALPIFDSALPDFNLTELFRTNRYVGSDRIGDANQLALALTTRLFDHNSGAQYLSATIGQIRYFSIPQVGLTDTDYIGPPAAAQALQIMPTVNPLAVPGALIWRGQSFTPYPGQYLLPDQYLYGFPRQPVASEPGQTSPTYPASDIIADVSLTGYKHMSVNLDYQWNPYTSQTEKSEISVQYHPDFNRVVNIGYRFQQGILKQYDGSFAWPIAEHWNTVGRWVYSLQDHQTIEQVAGFEYKSCCYRIELVQRRYISNHNGGLDTSFALQLELTGLSSVGKREDSFLERSIRGYSTRDPNIQ
jgi:LPS-assembly protein